MADKDWKKWERDFAKAIGGRRFWANSGESVDCEGPVILAQCKQVKAMSLNSLVQLAVKAEHDGKNRKKGYLVDASEVGPMTEGKPVPSRIKYKPTPKIGVVGVKPKPGRGKKSIPIVVMTLDVFKQFYPVGGQ